MNESTQDTHPPHNKNERHKKGDDTKEKGLKVLLHIKTRLQTGHHAEGLSKGEKSNINKQLPHFVYNSDSDKLFKREDDRLLEVLLCSEKKKRVFDEAHAGHVGENSTMENISRNFYWRNMVSEVKDLRNRCEGCQKQAKTKTLAPELKSIDARAPWHKVGIDLVGKLPTTPHDGYEYILSVTCLFSKWVELYPLKRKSGPDVALRLEQFIMRHGAPTSFISDQGREFCNEINQSLFTRYGVRHMVTSAYHPQANGQAESTNRVLKDRLRKMVNERQDNWDKFLDVIVHSLNHTARRSTKLSPYFILYGIHPRKVQQMETQNPEEVLAFPEPTMTDVEMEAYVEQRMSEREDLHVKVKASIEASQKKQKLDYSKKLSKNVKVFNFKEGDIVQKKNARKKTRMGDTLTSEWIGRYKITAVNLDTNTVKLHDLNRNEDLKRSVAYDQLKPFLTEPAKLVGVCESQRSTEELNPPAKQQIHDFTEEIPNSQQTSETDTLHEECMVTEISQPLPRVSPKQPTQMRRPARSVSFHDTIVTGSWLTDEHIDSAQYLLALQFERADIVFQPCTVVEAGSGGANVGTPDHGSKFVQIILINNNHWITLSNKGCSDGTVNVYDSMPPSDIGGDATRAVCWLMFHCDAPLSLQWPDIAHQAGGSDCGLFAIAVATSLCFGIDPTRVVFDQIRMRDHLVQCFQQQEMTPFPLRQYRQPYHLPLYSMFLQRVCVCKQLDTWDACLMCQKCRNRFHPTCVSASGDVFFCEMCRVV